jgi:radical SAM superfamily enzyme YgiQ (UPF0313 family)
MGALFNCEPLELEYLYTMLHDIAEVRLLDGQVTRTDLRREIINWQPQLLLLTSMINSVNLVTELARQVKQLPEPPQIFVGGPHAEVLPEHYFSPDIDGVFFSDQLRAIREVVMAINEGRSFQQVKGAAFRIGDTFLKNESQPVDLLKFPIPERPLLSQNRGKYYILHYEDCATLKTSFGCPEKCTFCFCRKMNQEAYGRRPLPEIMDEIESIPNQNIFVVDDNFLLSPKRLQEFCSEIERRNIRKRFIVYATSRFIAQHPDLMRQLRKAGLSAVMVGFEFIDDASLAAYQKGSALADNEATIRICRELDIDLFALFMLDPAWSRDQFRKLARYIRSRRIYLATFGTLTTLPGTDLWLQQGAEAAPDEAWWRYDLLRLHQQPKYLSRFGYYLWVMYLYLLPTLRPDGLAYFIRRSGWKGSLRIMWNSFLAGINFFYKLSVWP